MSAKTTWLWSCIAVGLFGFILFFERHRAGLQTSPQRLLPSLRPANVASVLVEAGALQIRANHTNDAWQLVSPLTYPAQSMSIEGFLSFLEQLTPSTYITPAQLRSLPDADNQYGLVKPQASVSMQQGNGPIQIRIGTNTAWGDKVYLQVVGDPGVYVVSVELMKYIPRTASDWRDTTLISLSRVAFNRLAVTNSGKPSVAFVVQRDSSKGLWEMTWPQPVRANNRRLEECLAKLQGIRIQQFVTEDLKLDGEALGLTPPSLEIGIGEGTNSLTVLQFGRSPTNAPDQVYARRAGDKTVFTVTTNLLAPWFRPLNDFRDPHLVTLTSSVEAIGVRGDDHFSVVHQTNGFWSVVPEGADGYPADTVLVTNLLFSLTNMQITGFIMDAANPAELLSYGLAAPRLQVWLTNAPPASTAGASNAPTVHLKFGFGTNQLDRVFAQRADENSVYAVSTNDFARLPIASYELRERKLWNFSETNVARLAIRQRGKILELVRNGNHSWSGSASVAKDGGVAAEETVRGLGQLSATAWVGHGEQCRARCGFAEADYQITLELKNGEKRTVELGREAPSGTYYAAVTLDGQPWIFELAWKLYRDVAYYLSAF
jgi:hypothetical protein